MADYYVGSDGVVKKKKRKTTSEYYVGRNGDVTKRKEPEEDNIAPVKTTTSAFPVDFAPGKTTKYSAKEKEPVSLESLMSVSGSKDFKSKSGYVSTKSDGFWEKLGSKYGMNYNDLQYEYINNQNGIRDEINRKAISWGSDTGKTSSSYKEKALDYMTDDEVAVYNYYYQTKGKDEAEKFLDALAETLNARKAGKDFESIEGNTTREILYGTVAGAEQFKQGVKSFGSMVVGKDDYIPQTSTQILTGKIREDLADDGESVKVFGNSLGQLGFDAISTGTNMLPSMMTGNPVAGVMLMGSTAAGNTYQESLNEGNDKDKARIYATTIGALEGTLQYALGGIGKLGGTSKIITNAVSGVKNGALRFSLEYGGKIGSEALEEGLQEVLNPLVKNVVYGTDESVNWEEAAYSALLGGLMGGVFGASEVSRSHLNTNEQTVVDKVYEDTIAEKEADGKKLTAKEKADIREQVMDDLERGRIDTDTIESVLGGETYKNLKSVEENETKLQEEHDTLKKEYDELNKMKLGEMTGEQTDRKAEIKKRLEEINKELKNNSESQMKSQIRSQLDSEMSKIVEGSKLAESYNEIARRGQNLEVDVESYTNENAKQTAQNFKDFGVNNTNASHDYLDLVTKVAKDRGHTFQFMTTKQLEESIANGNPYNINVDANKVEAFVDGGSKTIVINMDANKSLSSLVGHEVTHTLENHKSYGSFQSALFELAKTRGEYEDRLASVQRRYSNLTEEQQMQELASDLVGDYIFGDTDFVKNLSTQNPNVFQKIYNEIKYLWKMATAGSKEKRELERVKREFEKAWQEAGEVTSDADVKFSVREEAPPKETGIAYKVFYVKDGKLYPPMVANPDGADTPMGVWLNADVGKEAAPSKTGRQQVKAGGKGTQGGSGSLAFRPGWHLGDLPRASQFDRTNPETGAKELFPKDFVWAEVEYAKDVDYQEEAMSYGYTDNGKFRHAYAGLPRLPENGYYRYRTNPKPDTVPWIITGAMKVNRLLSDAEVNSILEQNGVQPVHRQGGDVGLDAFGFNEDGSVRYSLSEEVDNVSDRLTMSEWNQVKTAVADYAKRNYHYEKSSDGDIIIPIGNKLVYTDANYDSPGISKIIEFDSEYEDDIDFARKELYEVEKGKSTHEDAQEIIRLFTGIENINQYKVKNRENVGRYDRRTSRGKSQSDSYHANFLRDRIRRANEVINSVNTSENSETSSEDGVFFDAEKESDVKFSVADENIKVEVNDFYSGEMFATMSYTQGGKVVGTLEYSEYNGEPSVKMVEVLPEYRRKGIGKKLLQELQRIYPDVEIDFGMTTPDGTKLLDSITYIQTDENVVEGKRKLTELQTELSEVERRLNELYELEELTEEQEQEVESLGERWDKLYYTEIPKLTEEYGDKKAYRRFVRTRIADDASYTTKEYGRHIYSKNVALDGAAEIAPTTSTVEEMPIRSDYAPLTEEEANVRDDRQIDEHYFMDDMPADTEEESYNGTYATHMTPADPFYEKDIWEVGKDRKQKAYMYENPEVKPYFQAEALYMLGELNNSQKGEKFYNDQLYYDTNGEMGWFGTKRFTSDDIAYLLDSFNYTYKDIEKGLNAIIEDNGKENNAISKRIEFLLDERLRTGYTEFPFGDKIPPNQEYINLLNEKEITQYNDESWNNWLRGLSEDDIKYLSNTREDIAPPQEYMSAEPNSVPVEQDIAPVKAEVPLYDAQPRKGVVEGQQSMFEEPAPQKTITRSGLHKNIIDNIKSVFSTKGFDFDDVLKNAKNLSTFATVDNTPQRVMEKALGYKQGQALSDLTVNKVAQNESEGTKWLNSFTDRKNGLLAQISKQYKIKPGSKESAAAQMFAEGFYVNDENEIIAYGEAELAKDFPDPRVRENIKGLANDERIRQIYDDTLARINESRTRNAYPEIPRLDNYFLHFRAMDDTFSRLGLPFNPNDIRAKDLPTDLNGVTADLKPGQPYFASQMHRTGKRTSFDLLGGLERYLTSAKNQIYHIDDIQTLRALRNYIADTYGQANGLEGLDALSEEEAQERIEQVYSSHLSTFAKFLNEEANVLAGKTTLIDRGLEGIIGRRGITFLNTVNGQVGSNMVGFNVSSSLTNVLPVVQTFAKTNKADFVKAFSQTVSNKIGSLYGKTDGFADQSPVMIRRKGADRFYRTPFQKVGDTGYVLMSAIDDFTTEIIARTKYNELTRKGMDSQKAHYETDKWVSRLMGDRSLGQMPQLYNSKMLGLITKFQLEVRNQLDSQFYDTIQEAKVSSEHIQNGLERNAKTAAKVASTFAQLAVSQHLFGAAFEAIAGYNPAFDIIEVLLKTVGYDDDEESEDTALDNVEQGFLMLLEDLPYASTLTGGRIPISSALPVKELITGVDEYGNEKSRWETLGEVAPYYLLPTGYGQLKKSAKGLQMFDEDLPISGSYTDSGNLRFTVEDTPQNRLKAGIFGQYASDVARDYFDNERSPLKEKQIQEYIDVDIPIRDYWEYREGLSGLKTLSDKADYINSLDLPIDKKNILVNNQSDRKEPIDLTDFDEDYENFEEFDFAVNNPEKYEIALEVGGYKAYKEYKEGMKDMKIAEKIDYVANLDLTIDQKNALINGETDRKEPIDLTGYENYGSYEEFELAKESPKKYSAAMVVGYDDYADYMEVIDEIRADKDSDGKTINGSAKRKKTEYINSLDLDYGQKIILYRSLFDSQDDKDAYNADIVDYLNSRDDITYEEMLTILESLDMKVLSDGRVTW